LRELPISHLAHVERLDPLMADRPAGELPGAHVEDEVRPVVPEADVLDVRP
jgi:hypothetical protein